jgi:hypothetical protein
MRRILLAGLFCVMLSSAIAANPKAGTSGVKSCNLKIGDKYAGGIIFYLDSGTVCHGLVCAPVNQSANINWAGARALCNSLVLGGYSDWRLPTGDELHEMFYFLYKPALADFATNYYWSSTEDNNGLAYAQNFSRASQDIYRFVFKDYSFGVRAVRRF